MIPSPDDLMRRSPVHRQLLAEGLRLDAPGAEGLPLAGKSRAPEGALVLIDLSVLPRWGLKGRNAFAWLAAHGAEVPAADQRAVRQADGTLIGRLAPGEALVLPPVTGRPCPIGAAIDRLAPAGSDRCYPVPRRDSHNWLAVRGRSAPQMFAKLCGVDLAANRFPPNQIAQTSVARLSAIVIRSDLFEEPAFFVLADSAGAEYLWDCLRDAMTEFGGTVEGADRLGFDAAAYAAAGSLPT